MIYSYPCFGFFTHIHGGNKFTGSIGLERLPARMESIRVFCNQLSGSLVLTQLPSNLEELILSKNQFSGALDLTRLPSSMSRLYLENNSFSGTLDLSQLPQGLEDLYLSDNELSANPTKGHLSVVGWTSTPVLGEAKNLFKPLVVFLSWRRPY
ncbi:hypothetical protein XU18_3841 [Perkinsela sp. CCAP 1560/4]|nr:hypothetical protein XU18_3841 [Perkinsela sp. CCAP 1560/4]|eukprot:KNH05041.1 hypothetical protein XU18_3841 [Perkinsela sp. CCAP 1560/4]